MVYWVTPEEMALMDRRTIEAGTPGHVLMERAGVAVAEAASRLASPSDGPVHVWCGRGNNGGDGFVVARHLLLSGYDVLLVLAAEEEVGLSPDCALNRERFVDSGGDVLYADSAGSLPGEPALTVDALLGTGFRGRLRGTVAECLRAMARGGGRVLAVDTPTGVDCGTGQVDPLTLRATATVTFAAPKVGLLLPPGCGMTGAVLVADIGIEVDEDPSRRALDMAGARALLPERPAGAHKGTFGRLLLVGGSEAMTGAPQLMAMGALRSGAGLVTLCVPDEAYPLVAGRVPETLGARFRRTDPGSLPDPGGFDAAALGPGMGNDSCTAATVGHVLSGWSVPLVLDADGLNALEDPVSQLSAYGGPLVLTPHPGELSRLTGCDPSDQPGCVEAALRLSADTGAAVLLKGRPTRVLSPDGSVTLVAAGNDGLSTGGSGDVLTGMVCGLLGQGLRAGDAAALAAWVHGAAAEAAASRTSTRSLLPTEVADSIGETFRAVELGRPEGLLTSGGRWTHELAD